MILARTRSLLLLPILGTTLLLAAPEADAARERAVDTTQRVEGPPPAAPEPTGALAFAVGIGAIAFAIRRYRSR